MLIIPGLAMAESITITALSCGHIIVRGSTSGIERAYIRSEIAGQIKKGDDMLLLQMKLYFKDSGLSLTPIGPVRTMLESKDYDLSND
jgi:hypothetical protein